MSASGRLRTKRQRAPFASLRERMPRMASLRRAGVNFASFFSCGSASAASWGAYAIGIATPPSMRWRRDIARGCLAAAAGKTIDIVFVFFVDKAPTDPTHPDFVAHVLPIEYWAQRVWDGWCFCEAIARSRRCLARKPIISGVRSPDLPVRSLRPLHAQGGASYLSTASSPIWTLNGVLTAIISAREGCGRGFSTPVAGGTHSRCIFDVRPRERYPSAPFSFCCCGNSIMAGVQPSKAWSDH